VPMSSLHTPPKIYGPEPKLLYLQISNVYILILHLARVNAWYKSREVSFTILKAIVEVFGE